jgi:ataxia telangiectasia mutated family protein
VEWCNDTRPLSDYLVRGGRSAHRRLRPDDITNEVARSEMEIDPPIFASQRAAFASVCDRFKPVMHNFFIESFPAPSQWYERRLAYTRSVAVSSMVGYIIGLGDRHSSNILIGCQTGELVHIDLGIAFDQGELLPTPETVPFRLTRDIVDGCGAAGVEGVLRRCCEESLSVLRANKESLVTLIEVLIHDPILKWAMSPELARRHQAQRHPDADADEHLEDELLLGQYGAQGVQNADAERALLRVRQKLDGVDDGQPRPVEAQVQQLLQNARDPDKLCRLFPGWAAWV